MDISNDGVNLLIAREAVRTKAYLDSVGVWTIGVGHTAAAGPPKPRKGMEITVKDAKTILFHDLVVYEDAVDRLVKVPMAQHEFDALVSLVFNIGEGNFRKSSVLRYLNAGDRSTAAKKFRLWNKGKVHGKLKVIQGLVNRRNSEMLQFLGK